MKIFDCITYYDEELLFDIRCHYLDSFVDYFVVVEAKFTHSGEPKKLNFDINKFPKFKSKIIYHIIENEPENIKNINSNNDTNDNLSIKRLNSLKRIEQSYDETMKAVASKEPRRKMNVIVISLVLALAIGLVNVIISGCLKLIAIGQEKEIVLSLMV